jgi:hypothetical protein
MFSTPIPIELSNLTYFIIMGVFFSRLGTNIFKMIINLPICHQIRKKGQFNWNVVVSTALLSAGTLENGPFKWEWKMGFWQNGMEWFPTTGTNRFPESGNRTNAL